MSKNIDTHRATSICKIGQKADCCRYITANSAGFQCAKHTDLKAIIDRKVASGDLISKSDNCDGLI